MDTMTNEPLRNQINLTVDISPDLLEHIEKKATEETVIEIRKLAKNKLLRSSGYFSRNEVRDTDPLQDWAMDLVKDILMENKDLIIEKAAHEFAGSMARSKTVREKFGDRLEEMLNDD